MIWLVGRPVRDLAPEQPIRGDRASGFDEADEVQVADVQQRRIEPHERQTRAATAAACPGRRRAGPPAIPASQKTTPLALLTQAADGRVEHEAEQPFAAIFRDAQKFTLPAPAPMRPPSRM